MISLTFGDQMLFPWRRSPAAVLDLNDLAATTHRDISVLLQDTMAACNDYRRLKVGKYRYEIYRIFKITLADILGNNLQREFLPQLSMLINDIKEAPQLNKQQLHQRLLHKYLGIQDLNSQTITPQRYPNALKSSPTEAGLDEDLHQAFLHPYTLYKIRPAYRKYFRDRNAAHDDFQQTTIWHLGKSEKHIDIAPLFRKIMQLYVLSAILEDYADPNNPFAVPEIRQNLQKLMNTHQMLKEGLKEDFQALAKFTSSLSRNNSQHEDYFPYFPLGQLLLKRFPSDEIHHLTAKKYIASVRNPFIKAMLYPFYWVLSHLNLFAPVLLLKLGFKSLKDQGTYFKNYLQGNQPPDYILMLGCLVVDAIMLIASPFAFILPLCFGIFSMPFSLIRALLYRIRGFNVDLISTAIISVDFYQIIFNFPSVFSCLQILTVLFFTPLNLLPSDLLSVGQVLVLGDEDMFNFMLAESIANLAVMTIKLFGVGLIGLGALIVAKNAWPYLPDVVRRNLTSVAQSLEKSFTSGLDWIKSLMPPAKPEQTLPARPPILPRECGLTIPEVVHAFQPTEAQKEDIARWRNQLGTLNMSFHLSPERKKLFGDALNRLDHLTTPACFEEAKTAIESLLQDTFTPEETRKIKTFAERLLDREDPSFSRQEQVFMRNRTYQPSWQALQALRNGGFIQENGQWQNLPEGVEITPEMQEKCQRIWARKP